MVWRKRPSEKEGGAPGRVPRAGGGDGVGGEKNASLRGEMFRKKVKKGSTPDENAPTLPGEKRPAQAASTPKGATETGLVEKAFKHL